MDYKDLLVSPEDKIKDAIKAIDKGGIQLALLVERDGTFVGTITDGDIRRGLLKGVTLEDSVQKVANSNPLVAKLTHSDAQLKLMMTEKMVDFIPVLDDDQKVIQIKLLSELSDVLETDATVFLLAGGYGKRLGELTKNKPKPLLDVGGSPILQHSIMHFKRMGFDNFVISVHYKSEMIKDHFKNGKNLGVNIRYVEESEPLGTAGSLGYLENFDKPIIVMNGDVLTKTNFKHLIDFHNDHEADLTIACREYDFQIPFGVVESNGHLVEKVSEKPVHTFFVNAGIYVLNPVCLEFIKKGKHLDMTTLVNKMSAAGKKVCMFPVHEYWIDVGRIDEYHQAKSDFKENF